MGYGELHKVLTLPATVWLAKTNSVIFLKRKKGKTNNKSRKHVQQIFSCMQYHEEEAFDHRVFPTIQYEQSELTLIIIILFFYPYTPMCVSTV